MRVELDHLERGPDTIPEADATPRPRAQLALRLDLDGTDVARPAGPPGHAGQMAPGLCRRDVDLEFTTDQQHAG